MSRLQVFASSRGYILGREGDDGRVSSPMSSHAEGRQGGLHSVHGSVEYVAGSPNVRKYTTLCEAVAARDAIEHGEAP